MGFKKNWDVSDITSQVHSIAREAASPYNDGFTSWYAKQDLYVLKNIVDQALKDSPNFGDLETQWLKEQEQKRILKFLKD
jgi:hypothetical protein